MPVASNVRALMRSAAPLLWIVLALCASDVLAQTSLCQADEVDFDSCVIERKVASFCASKKITEKSGYLQYRFGTPEKVEMAFPAVRRNPRGLFFRSMSADGRENRISFKNGRYTYISFSIDSPQGASFGMYILKDGKLVSDRSCSEQFSDKDPAPYSFIGWEKFLRFKR